MSQPWPILVINLDRSTDRLASITSALNRFDLQFDRVKAIEAKELTDTLPKRSHLFGEFFADLTPTERACRASHLNALTTVAASSARAVLVMEDDADFDDDARMILAEIAELPGALPDCISLYGMRTRGAPLVHLPSGRLLISSVTPPIGAVAILWTPVGARKFLAVAGRRMHRPIDVQRKHWWEGNLNAAWVSPPPIKETTHFGSQSTIGERRQTGPMAAIAKWSYRARFTVSSHSHFMIRHGVIRWLAAQERIR